MRQDPFVLGVDLDGVCTDLLGSYRQVVADIRGVDPDDLGPVTDYTFSTWGLTGYLTDQPEYLRALIEYRMCRSMNAMPGASASLTTLRDQGIMIRLITARLVRPKLTTVIEDTAYWLERHRIPFDELCMVSDKPSVSADIYIDDAPPEVQHLRMHGQKVVIFDQPYNQTMDGPRAASWQEIVEVIKTQTAAS